MYHYRNTYSKWATSKGGPPSPPLPEQDYQNFLRTHEVIHDALVAAETGYGRSKTLNHLRKTESTINMNNYSQFYSVWSKMQGEDIREVCNWFKINFPELDPTPLKEDEPAAQYLSKTRVILRYDNNGRITNQPKVG